MDIVNQNAMNDKSPNYNRLITKIESMYQRRNILEQQLQRINKQIEMMNQNPIIGQFFELDK